MACLEWVMEGICLASGRKKLIPVTFHCSPGQLINGVALTASPPRTFLPPWPLKISTQVKRDYTETDGSSGGRKPDTEIHADALKQFQKKTSRACQKPASRPETAPARSKRVSECLGQLGLACH